MNLDYEFLKGYLAHEIARLEKIAANNSTAIFQYKEKADKIQFIFDAGQITGEKWQYGHALENFQNKIIEAEFKNSIVKPKIIKLKEQLAIMSV